MANPLSTFPKYMPYENSSVSILILGPTESTFRNLELQKMLVLYLLAYTYEI